MTMAAYGEPLSSISFSLRADEADALRSMDGDRKLSQYQRWYLFVGGALYFAVYALRAVSAHRLIWSYELFFGFAWIALGIVQALAGRYPPFYPRTVDLDVRRDGLFGTRDGRKVDLPWRRIDSVADRGEFVFVAYRGVLRPIVIPKRAIPDFPPFWTLIDDHLTAKRGLVVRPGRKLIVNSVR
jgi:hypothetical protein